MLGASFYKLPAARLILVGHPHADQNWLITLCCVHTDADGSLGTTGVEHWPVPRIRNAGDLLVDLRRSRLVTVGSGVRDVLRLPKLCRRVLASPTFPLL